MKVAIAGARGIGRHHAKWYARLGCDVCAIYARSEESGRAAAAALREDFAFQGQIYWDWERFLDEIPASAASVCTPAEHHLNVSLDLLKRGIHVLCEKPLHWRRDAGPDELIGECRVLADGARRHNLLFAVNAQYPAVMPGWRQMSRRILGRDPDPEMLRFTIESRGAGRGMPGAQDCWVDLGPHALALLDSMAPGLPESGSVEHEDGEASTSIRLRWKHARGAAHLHFVGRRFAEPPVRRQFGDRDLLLDYRAVEEEGDWMTELSCGAETWRGPDLMQESIHRFVRAIAGGDRQSVLVPLDAALRQQEALVRIWNECWGRDAK